MRFPVGSVLSRNRSRDLVYFSFIVIACLVGYFASIRSSEAPFESESDFAAAGSAEFSAPELALEIPFEFPYAIPEFETRTAPRLLISGGVESVLVEVRTSLLASSTPVEVTPMAELASRIE